MRITRAPKDRITVSTSIPFDPNLIKPENPKGLLLLLHGYDQSGSYMISKLKNFIPEDWAVVSPNALFPIPHWDAAFPAPGWREQGLKLGYTWYFYQSRTREYFLDMNPALQFLENGVRQLGFADLPKIVVGFSQGGYVAPFIAMKLSHVLQVVCLSSEFIPSELPTQLDFRMDGIFGDNDSIASIEDAKRSHSDVLAKGLRGEFHTVKGAGHEVSSLIGEKLREILATV